jgi:hypothetical protein
MTVKELIEQLQQCDPDDLVVMSKDSEGNGFSKLSDIAFGNDRYSGGYSGEIGLDHLTEELEQRGYTEDDVMSDGEKCIVLWPLN